MKKLFFLTAAAIFAASGTAQTPAELKSWLPPVEGGTIDEKVEVFNPDNLFERINGAAPLYLESGFQEMTSMEYKKGEEYITIQAYRHATPEDTFGMYASERSPDLEFYPFAGEAQGDAGNVFFFAGNIYVKMWGYSEGDISGTLQQIARGLAEKIAPNAGYPAVLQAFPAANKVAHTEAYITSNYIGHEFLTNVYTTDYMVDGKKYQGFVIDAGTPEAARETLVKYYAFARQTVDPQLGVQTIADRYNGDIPVIWQGRYLIGIFSSDSTPMPGAEAFLAAIAASIAKQ
jgi:hypothetical protein